ncbi:hypothetical protein ASF71_10470 [Deinococcus sp. Leaf326]|nr:hypothetical protein ASF71_10470 [Deinococcus sp. Leaf326]
MSLRCRLTLGLALLASMALADGRPTLALSLTPAAYARLAPAEQAQYVRYYRGQAIQPFLIELRRSLPPGIGTVKVGTREMPVFVVRSAETAGRTTAITQYGRSGQRLKETIASPGPR